MQSTAHAFWRFSLRVYRTARVESACIALQDGCGADVNVLLLCGWLASRGRSLDRRRLRQAMARVGAWQSEVVAPLRKARRAHKRLAGAMPQQEDAARTETPLHQRLLALELELEYAEQSMLVALAQTWPPPARVLPPTAAAQRNLERYLQLLGDGPAPDRAAADRAALDKAAAVAILVKAFGACAPSG